MHPEPEAAAGTPGESASRTRRLVPDSRRPLAGRNGRCGRLACTRTGPSWSSVRALRALLRASDEAELLEAICRIAVDEAGYRLAWVGLVEDDAERTVRPVAQAGDEAGYLGSTTIAWADTPLGQGPTATAIHTGRPAVGRSFHAGPELAPWQETSPWLGAASSLALPLRAGDGMFGALTIYAQEPDAFSTGAVELLASVADDLAFGITALRARSARAATDEGLLSSERNLADAQRIAHIGSWEWEIATDAALRSDEAHRIFGVAPGAFPSTNAAYLEFVHPDDRERVQASEQEAITRGRLATDFRIIRPDGTVRIVREQAELTRDASGTPVRLVGTVQDITERVALETQQTRLLRLLDELHSEVYVLDSGTLRFTGANASAIRNLGYSLAELLELTPLDIGFEQTMASMSELLEPLRSRTRDHVTLETVQRRKDGSTYPVEARVHFLETEAPPAFVVVSQDITDRRAADAERTRLASAVEQTADSVMIQDLSKTITYVNPAFCRLYGYAPDEVLGRTAGLLGSGRHEPDFWAPVWATAGSGRTWAGRVVNRRKDGSLHRARGRHLGDPRRGRQGHELRPDRPRRHPGACPRTRPRARGP